MKITIIYGPRVEEVRRKGSNYLKRLQRWAKEHRLIQ